jgi:hypothetical protein
VSTERAVVETTYCFTAQLSSIHEGISPAKLRLETRGHEPPCEVVVLVDNIALHLVTSAIRVRLSYMLFVVGRKTSDRARLVNPCQSCQPEVALDNIQVRVSHKEPITQQKSVR